LRSANGAAQAMAADSGEGHPFRMRVRVIGATLLGASGVTGVALAGNLDSYYMSAEAALQGGAITADSRDGGAMWYNPAGLGEIPGLRLDVGANAFRLSFGGVPDLEATGKDPEITRLRTINFISVPVSMTLTHRFGDLGVGFGLFVPTNDSSYLRTQLKERSETGDHAIELGLDAHSTLTDYFIGPSVGWKIGREVSVGMSLFVNYRTELGVSAVEGNVIDPDGSVDAAFVDHETDDWQQIGAQGVFGIQIHPDRFWAAGITLRTPVLRLYQVRQQIRTLLTTENGQRPEPSNRFDETSGLDAEIIAPSRVHLGLSRRFELWHVSLEANYQFPFEEGENQIELLAVANARAGLRYQWSRTLRVGGGLYTDRSPTQAKTFTDNGLNYYGLTIAGELSTPYETIKKGDETFTRPRGLVFATGVALSYAAGFGRVVRADVVTSETAAIEIQEVPTRAVDHELILHVTSSLGE
jgi:hypothetical protein